MLDDPLKRAEIAKKIVQDSRPKRRPSDYDGLEDEGTNSLDGKFFGGNSVRLDIPNTDPVVTREVLVWVQKRLHHLIHEMDQAGTPRTKRLIVATQLRRWTRGFKTWGRE